MVHLLKPVFLFSASCCLFLFLNTDILIQFFEIHFLSNFLTFFEPKTIICTILFSHHLGISEYYVNECRVNSSKVQTVVDDFKSSNLDIMKKCRAMSESLLIKVYCKTVESLLSFFIFIYYIILKTKPKLFSSPWTYLFFFKGIVLL